MAGIKASETHDSDYQEQPGMNVSLMERDATQFEPNNVLRFAPLGAGAGPFVGDPFSGVSGLGNKRAMITYAKGGRGKSPRTGAGR